MIRAICMAAEELNSPIILAHYLNTGTYAGHDWFLSNCQVDGGKSNGSVAIHLDHGDSFQHCMEMLQLGFTSIMYDGSSLPLEENASTTAEVVRVCHAFGVPVEAEMGQLARWTQSNTQEEASVVNPEDVRRFLELCSPDFGAGHRKCPRLY